MGLATVKSDLKGFQEFGRHWDRHWLKIMEPVIFERNLRKEACRRLLSTMMSLDAG